MSRPYRVLVAASAERDLAEITAHIAQDSPGVAEAWLEALADQIASLEHFPRRAAVIPEAVDLGVTYRHLVHGRYRTIFRIEEDRVIVLRVIHGARLLDTEALGQ